MTGKPEQDNTAPPAPVLRFDYIKSNLYRVIHVDGVVGGVTPTGNLAFSLFNERSPVPQQVTHAVEKIDADTARLGAEIRTQRVTRDALVREVEIGLVMDYRTALTLHRWLTEQLAKFRPVEKEKRAEPVE